jgi:hypothetical protein
MFKISRTGGKGMNERIRELLKQATVVEYGVDNGFDRTTVDQEKFAELIVRECIQVCEPILDEPYENMTEFGKGLVEGQDVAIERIKEHFGVGE